MTKLELVSNVFDQSTFSDFVKHLDTRTFFFVFLDFLGPSEIVARLAEIRSFLDFAKQDP